MLCGSARPRTSSSSTTTSDPRRSPKPPDSLVNRGVLRVWGRLDRAPIPQGFRRRSARDAACADRGTSAYVGSPTGRSRFPCQVEPRRQAIEVVDPGFGESASQWGTWSAMMLRMSNSISGSGMNISLALACGSQSASSSVGPSAFRMCSECVDRGDRGARGLVFVGPEMTVGVKGGLRRGVSQPSLHDLHVKARGNQ
jgi:hypothetical protein